MFFFVHHGLAHDLDILDTLEQSIQNTADYDIFPLVKPKPVPCWRQWLTFVAERVLGHCEHVQKSIKNYYTISACWLACQSEWFGQHKIRK
jgi:hypothetical protein